MPRPFGLAALALLATAASAQPADRIGLYGVFGAASPERLIFRDAADPLLTVGYRLSPRADVQVGARFGRQSWIARGSRGLAVVENSPVPPQPGDLIQIDIRDQTRALAAAVGWTQPAGRAEVRSRLSLGVDALDRTVSTLRYPDVIADPSSPFEPVIERGQATFAHTGLSAVVAIPVEGLSSRAAPGVGLAVASSRRLRGTLGAPRPTVMAFANLPTTASVGGVLVTLDMTAGVARALDGPTAARWAPRVEAGLRVEI